MKPRKISYKFEIYKALVITGYDDFMILKVYNVTPELEMEIKTFYDKILTPQEKQFILNKISEYKEVLNKVVK